MQRLQSLSSCSPRSPHIARVGIRVRLSMIAEPSGCMFLQKYSRVDLEDGTTGPNTRMVPHVHSRLRELGDGWLLQWVSGTAGYRIHHTSIPTG